MGDVDTDLRTDDGHDSSKEGKSYELRFCSLYSGTQNVGEVGTREVSIC